MAKKKKTAKKENSSQTETTSTSEKKEKVDVSNCEACMFMQAGEETDNPICRRHCENLNTLLKKNIITVDAKVCGMFISNLR